MRKSAGTYFGHVKNRTICDGALMSEVSHSCQRCLPEHTHEHAYFSTLICGKYFEEVEGRRFEYRPFETGFHPSGMPHRDAIGKEGARFLCLEITQDNKNLLDHHWESKPILLSEEVAIPMARAYGDVVQNTFSSLCLEGVLWELTGAVARFDMRWGRKIPHWLKRCVELIRENYSEAITIQCMALNVGIHPVHISREFRRLLGQTVGEYTHQIRVRSACSRLISDRNTIAQIATDCGFSDHSHFCRVFKKLVGRTPLEYRRAHISHTGVPKFHPDAVSA